MYRFSNGKDDEYQNIRQVDCVSVFNIQKTIDKIYSNRNKNESVHAIRTQV